MAKYAKHVYTEQDKIATLESWVKQLPDEARVQVTLDDGSRLLGTVAVRPTVQSFRDEADNEGINGLLRLDDLDHPGQPHWVWLDTIREVRPLPPIED
ncbi:MAG TPA: DUF3247 family protein [Stenotrophomonas sp.]|nr:DUF3247 family protein [Stenotrophomonas sp.]